MKVSRKVELLFRPTPYNGAQVAEKKAVEVNILTLVRGKGGGGESLEIDRPGGAQSLTERQRQKMET